MDVRIPRASALAQRARVSFFMIMMFVGFELFLLFVLSSFK
ncbi:MAG: hypothetical protein JWM16_1927 [Verrucomicrobiales bacterium]|nr:hypothetical protein [Verrucomicrobiales bacterium]